VTAAATQTARPAMIEDPSNLAFVHPMADRLLAPALRLGIHPNSVSFAGMGFGALAGLCYAHWHNPLAVAAGFMLMVAWHVMDGLDGKLARASGKTSPLGRLIDGLCDYMVFFLVLLPIVFSFDDWPPVLALALVSGLCHALQSAWYEGEREAWKRRARGIFHTEPRPPARFWGERAYNAVEQRLGSGTRAIDSRLAADPARLDAYLGATAPVLRRLSILSANNRTIAIAIACLAGDPRLYWGWEIVALSAAAFGLAAALRRAEAGII
jgi:CDP-diacylglycerol---serine O-phosphatidyltransferase